MDWQNKAFPHDTLFEHQAFAACPLQTLTHFGASFLVSLQGEGMQGNSSTGPFLPMGEVSKPQDCVVSPH